MTSTPGKSDRIERINPATEEPLEPVDWHAPAEVESRLARAAAAFDGWRNLTFDERARLFRRAALVLRARSAELSALMTLEMGKPVTGSEAEIEKCAAACDWFADNAPRLLADEPVPSDAGRSFVRYEPLGAVLAIMPWNFPFWQVFRFAAPTLMAGNVGVLKHAPNVPGCALAIENVFREAGFPEGVFTTLLIDTPATEAVIRDARVRAVTLTGSGRAGMSVAATAGSVLKKTVLELGGSDPFIVIPPDGHADRRQFLRQAADEAAKARCINSGQSCIAAKRFIVVGGDDDVGGFRHRLVQAMNALKVGDPTERDTEVGPQARLDLLENLDRQVQATAAAGGRVLTGGHRLPRKGYFYAPTVITRVTPGMTAFDEETFGPVAAVIDARTVDEAVELANHSRYGLGASVWTPDRELAERVAGRLEAGCVFVNGIVKSDPRLPFGGIKDSGYGRELSAAGIREFVNVKTVWVK